VRNLITKRRVAAAIANLCAKEPIAQKVIGNCWETIVALGTSDDVLIQRDIARGIANLAVNGCQVL